jgi:hypothetical protein
MKIEITLCLLISFCGLNGMFVAPTKNLVNSISRSFATKATEGNHGIAWLHSLNKTGRMREHAQFVERHAAFLHAFSHEAGESPDWQDCCEFATQFYLSDLSKSDRAVIAALAARVEEIE